MKTNQVLLRKMGDFDVSQRTSDGMFDGNALLSQWNKADGNTRRRMDDFLESKNTMDFIQALMHEESQRENFAIPENQVVAKGKVKTMKDGSKVPASIWMHPYLFIDFAMWLNPTFKVKVLKFVYDELIKYRNDAGDAYRDMSGAVAKLIPPSFMPTAMQKIAQALNHIIYGKHETEIRNTQADELKVRELYELERDVTKLINGRFITSYEQLVSYLRNVWSEKYMPKSLIA